MSKHSQLVENYLAAWNETDAQKRHTLISNVWSEQGGYSDPNAEVTGYDAISALITHVQSIAPGMRFRLASEIDSHHSYLRFTWELGPEPGSALFIGSDVVQLDQDGRFREVIGFLDQVPS